MSFAGIQIKIFIKKSNNEKDKNLCKLKILN